MAKVLIIGAGISGLSIAWNLIQRGLQIKDLQILEASSLPGGNLQTHYTENMIIESGPNGFLDNVSSTLLLADELGLNQQILSCNQEAALRFIYRKNKLLQVHSNPFAFLRSGLLPFFSTLRIALEPFAKTGCDTESVYSFAARRIGKDAASILVDAMVSGIFAGNSKKLELAAAFPKMAQMEKEWGSLFKAMMHKKKTNEKSGGPAGPGGKLTSFLKGMYTLPEKLAQKLEPAILYNSKVVQCKKKQSAYHLTLENNNSVEAQCVIFSCPAHQTGPIIKPLDNQLFKLLESIPFAPLCVVATCYKTAQMPFYPKGFGFLVPRNEGLEILGSLWTSSIWKNRTPSDSFLFRTMVGGAHHPQHTLLTDEQLLNLVTKDLSKALGPLPQPFLVKIFKYQHSIAQFNCGHSDKLQTMNKILSNYNGLFLAGSSYYGISVNHCTSEAGDIAQKVITFLQ